MNFIYKFINIVSITLWIPTLFVFKEKYSFDNYPWWLLGIIGVFVIFTLSAVSLSLTSKLGKDNLDECNSIELADNSFLPSYIGYIMISFSTSNIYQNLIAFTVITILLWNVYWQYFNLAYLLFGYHYYFVTTPKNSRVLIITKREIKNTDNLKFPKLQRINNTTYIEGGK